MKWLPHVRWGESSNSIVDGDDEAGTEGWYIQISWLGLMFAVEVGSTGRDRRMLERWRREDEAAR